MDQEQQNNQTNSNEEVRTFTQEDVNRIVSERLAKEKAKYEANSKADSQAKEEALSTREKELQVRELKATAREKLFDKQLPKELLDVINYSSEEEMNKSIDILEKTYGKQPYYSNGNGVVTHYTPRGGSHVLTDNLRAAFGLSK